MFYKTKGTCAVGIDFEIEEKDGVKTVKNVVFSGGCNGNTQGVSKLVQGRKAEDVIALLEGTDCGGRGTSCPDQIAKALKLMLA